MVPGRGDDDSGYMMLSDRFFKSKQSFDHRNKERKSLSTPSDSLYILNGVLSSLCT